MPIYEYASEDGKVIERFYKMNDVRPETLVEDGITYTRMYSMPMMAVVDLKKPKTIGSLAEANTERMIKQGKLAPKKPKKNPFWRKNKNKVDSDLVFMTPKQSEKYIKTGKK